MAFKLTRQTAQLASTEPNQTLTEDKQIISLLTHSCSLFLAQKQTHSCLTVFPIMGLIKAPPPYLWPCVYLPTTAPGKPKTLQRSKFKKPHLLKNCIIQLCAGTWAKTTPAKTSLIHVHLWEKSFDHHSKQSQCRCGKQNIQHDLLCWALFFPRLLKQLMKMFL